MFNTKRKRAVVLALIAFFCGATAVVAVDWKRFGGGFLAFFKPRSEPVASYAGSGAPAGGGILTAMADSHPGAAPPTQLAAPATHRHTSSVGGGSGSHKSDDDLFKYGDPAAGIPAGSFVVAQNDTPSGGGSAGAGPSLPGVSAPDTSATAPSGGDAGDGGVSSPAPAPTDGGTGDGGIVVKTPTPSPSPSPATPTPSPAPPPVVSTPTPPAPAPTPTQSGTSDQDPGNGGGDTPPPVVVPPTPPVSAVPEASNAAMMGLGALFLAVAAMRRRQNGQG